MSDCCPNCEDNCSANSFLFGLIFGALIGAVIAVIIYRQDKKHVIALFKKYFQSLTSKITTTPKSRSANHHPSTPRKFKK